MSSRCPTCGGGEVIATVELVERSADLKRELLDFSRDRRYERERRDAMTALGMDVAVAGEGQLIRLLDYFVLQHRLRSGDTIVEQFVDDRPDLPEPEREMLLGWRDVVESIFEVARHDGDVLVVENLVDDLIYRVRSNMGAKVLRRLRRGWFLHARLVPVGDDWLVSGAIQPIEKRARDRVYAAAAEVAMRQPELAFRNPDKLDQAWELQRADRDRFVRFFGTDMLSIPGDQLVERMREYYAFSRREVLAGLPGQEVGSHATRPLPELDYPAALVDSEAVGVIYDEVEGLSFFGGFGEFEQAFDDPTLLDQRPYRQRVTDYLDDDGVSPLPFRRMAERDPDLAGEVLGRVLHRKGFDWRRDGEALMRQRKASYFEQPSLPRVVPLSRRLAPHVGHLEP